MNATRRVSFGAAMLVMGLAVLVGGLVAEKLVAQPPIKDPPGPVQTSWPQVDFDKPASVMAFADAGRRGVLTLDGEKIRKPAVTYFGWLPIGGVFTLDGKRMVRVRSDRWVTIDSIPNPDAKMPDDKGWAWYLDLEDMRVGRMKCDVLVQPVVVATLTVRVGD